MLIKINYANFDRINATRWKFMIEFSQKLIKNSLLWNIDKWIISRCTKMNYSWSIKGINKEAKNSSFTESMNIIFLFYLMNNGIC